MNITQLPAPVQTDSLTLLHELDFQDHVFYFESLLPALAQYRALSALLVFTEFGLGMAGDKNQDGRLEYKELSDYLVSMRRISASDPALLDGLNQLLGSYWSLAGKKQYLTEEEVFGLFYDQLVFIVVETLSRPSIYRLMSKIVEEILNREKMRWRGRNYTGLVETINLFLQGRGVSIAPNLNSQPLQAAA
jgi:hypothetical protein